MFHCIRMRMSTLNSKQFSLFKVMKKPTQKGEHLRKCTQVSL